MPKSPTARFRNTSRPIATGVPRSSANGCGTKPGSWRSIATADAAVEEETSAAEVEADVVGSHPATICGHMLAIVHAENKDEALRLAMSDFPIKKFELVRLLVRRIV
jgi:hypothetical protein